MMSKHNVTQFIVIFCLMFSCCPASGSESPIKKEKLNSKAKKNVRAIKRKKTTVPKVHQALCQREITYAQLPDEFFCIKTKTMISREYVHVSPFMWLLANYQHERDQDLLAKFLSDPRTILNQVENNHTPLLISIMQGHPHQHYQLALMLLDRDIDPNLTSTVNAWSPLHEAIKEHNRIGSLALIETLLTKGASTDHQETKYGYNALHVLSRVGGSEQSNITSLLMQYGADPHALNYQGQNALLMAAAFLGEHKNISFLYSLASITKDLTHRDNKGHSLYTYIKNFRASEMLPLIKMAFDAHWQIRQVFDDFNCAICLDSLDQRVVMLNCGHKFHCACITEWKENSCPLCRANW